MKDRYPVHLIKGKDSSPISYRARQALIENGAYFDPQLEAYVVSGTLPWSYATFLPANNLIAAEVEIDYNPQCYQPRLPLPVIKPLVGAWEGPPVDDYAARLSWFRRGATNDAKPFLAIWNEESAVWAVQSILTSPAQAVAQGWQFLATASESIDMHAYLVDAAVGERVSKSTTEAIQNDLGGAAHQVAILGRRIS
ncbi:hypothetical protein [Pseudomonas sp. UMAB-40]|uniref:hypothetical protein n=1 Tax=Pseudomonas sp. UMAB-40 TaxID=1365407 RepID=UPI001C56C533|nr:hypothetical protein [Pseudomonas sp. UMAB-40]